MAFPARSTPGPHRAAAPLAAGLALNLLLGLEVVASFPWVRPTLSLSPDLLALVLLGCLLPVARPARPSPRFSTGRAVLAGGLSGVAGLRIADRIARELLGRPLDPAGDLPHVGNVAEMLATVLPTGALWVAVLLAAVAVIGLAVGVHVALGMLAAVRTRTGRSVRRAAAGAAALLLCFPSLQPPGGSAAVSALAMASAEVAPAVELTEPPLPAAPDLGGADFLVLFVESYGVAAFEDPGRRRRLEGATQRLEEDAAAGGFDFRSAQIQSPTFGGGSWKAHAAFFSGVWVDREDRYRALVQSDRESLVRRFSAARYRTVAFEPGIQGPWPDGGWYGFDRIFDAAAIGYDGPAMGWWKIPDQFTLYALYRKALAVAERPLFAKVSLIMSHIPYWPVPPYVTPWTRFDEGTAYDGPLRSVAHDDARDQAQLSERYVTSLEYEFRILGGFLRGFVPRRSLVVVVGDHQPPRLSLHDSDTWATPIHLFSQDPALLAPFDALGFERTLIPERGTSWRMSDFPRDLSRLFPPGGVGDERGRSGGS